MICNLEVHYTTNPSFLPEDSSSSPSAKAFWPLYQLSCFVTLIKLPQYSFITFNQLLFRVAPYSDSFAREVASEIKHRLAKEGIGVGLTIYQSPDEHPGRSLVEGVNIVLQLLAVVSLGASMDTDRSETLHKVKADVKSEFNSHQHTFEPSHTLRKR